MLSYFISESTKENYIYSCDKICIKGTLEYSVFKNFGRSLSDFLLKSYSVGIADDLLMPWNSRCLLDYTLYERFGISEYHYNINLKLSDNNSFYFGYLHNSNETGVCTWKIELNPNKCLPCSFVTDFLSFVYSCSKLKSIEISQCDIAIDFPLKRDCFYLEKDKRISTIINDGYNNTTEYLSKHNSHGFCKLYNKTAESKLDEIITRFEFTLKKYDYKSACDVFPKLHIYDNSQITFNDELPALSQNDEVFVELLRLHPEFKKRLTSRKQNKFAPYLNYDAPLYSIDYNCYISLIEKIKNVFLYVRK